MRAGVKALLLEDEHEQLKVTATGLKVFERQETKVRTFPLSLSLPLPLSFILYPSLSFFTVMCHATAQDDCTSAC